MANTEGFLEVCHIRVVRMQQPSGPIESQGRLPFSEDDCTNLLSRPAVVRMTPDLPVISSHLRNPVQVLAPHPLLGPTQAPAGAAVYAQRRFLPLADRDYQDLSDAARALLGFTAQQTCPLADNYRRVRGLVRQQPKDGICNFFRVASALHRQGFLDAIDPTRLAPAGVHLGMDEGGPHGHP
jgi:hypothetical protein